MFEQLRSFTSLMEDPEIASVALREFGSEDWQSRFIVATVMCLVALPQSDIADGVSTDGACVFYATTLLDEDAPAGPTLVYDPWVFTVDLGSCANYTFEKVGDPAWHYRACDSEDFNTLLLTLLGGSHWLPVRPAGSTWA